MTVREKRAKAVYKTKDYDVQFRDETGAVYWKSRTEIDNVYEVGAYEKRRRRAIFIDDLQKAEEPTDAGRAPDAD